MIRLESLRKVYGERDNAVVAVAGIDLHIPPGEMVAVMGPSGSGKSTLMNIIGCLDRPTAGRYWLAGQPVAARTDNELAELRGRNLGFVFQQFNLLPRMTAQQNVETPLMYRGLGVAEQRRRACAALAMVGLDGRGHHRPTELSGGQQQRVAIARAVVGDPAVLLADEPTGALDSRTGQEVLAIFQDLHRGGKTIVVVTHDERVARHCQRIVRFQDGRIIADERVAELLDARTELARLGDHPPGGEVAAG